MATHPKVVDEEVIYDDVGTCTIFTSPHDEVWSADMDGTLNLTGRQLRTLEPCPPSISAKLEKVILDFNALTTWPPNIQDLNHLQHLSVFGQVDRSKASENHKPSLSELPEGSLTPFVNLRHLDLGNNALKSLPQSVAHLSHLKVLDLRLNNLEEFPEVICNLANLERLVLSANCISEIPRKIGELSKLQVLSLANNQLTLVPGSICHLTQLKSLSLKNNQLKYLPLELYRLNKLLRMIDPGQDASSGQPADDDVEWGLNLQGNDRTLIKPDLSTCSKGVRAIFDYLQKIHSSGEMCIDFHGYRMDAIENSCSQNPYVSRLDLGRCQLVDLPNNISHCLYIHTLILDENYFSCFPLNILKCLEHLKVLSLRSQKEGGMSKIPERLANSCQSLTELYLGNNSIEFIPESIGDLQDLKVLELKNNKIGSLPEGLFRLKKLEFLALGKNLLDRLPENICQLTQLQVLLLSDNNMACFPDSICQMTKLMCLSLRKNKLRYIPARIDNLQKLKEASDFTTLHEMYSNNLRLEGNNLTLPGSNRDVGTMSVTELFGHVVACREQIKSQIAKIRAEKKDILTDAFLLSIAKEIGKEVNQLVTHLSLTPATHDQINEETRDSVHRRQKILLRWRDGFKHDISEAARLSVLKKALIDCNRRDIVDRFSHEFSD